MGFIAPSCGAEVEAPSIHWAKAPSCLAKNLSDGSLSRHTSRVPSPPNLRENPVLERLSLVFTMRDGYKPFGSPDTSRSVTRESAPLVLLFRGFIEMKAARDPN